MPLEKRLQLLQQKKMQLSASVLSGAAQPQYSSKTDSEGSERHGLLTPDLMEKHVYSILAKKDSQERKERNQEPTKYPTQNTYTPQNRQSFLYPPGSN